MPTYEYRCEACGNGWEMTQRMSESPVKICPKCGEEKARRLISGGNFLLKGDGWYKDLYHKPAAKKPSDSGSSGSSGEGGSTAGSSSTGSGGAGSESRAAT